MGLALALCVHIIWNIIRGILLLLRNLWWVLNGTSTQITKTHQTDAYSKTVQVLSIWARHKLDPVLQPSGPDNFIAFHSRFEDPDYVLADNVSLFYVTKTDAVFVEVDKGVDVSNSDYGPFVRIAQCNMARKLIMVPMHIFHQLGEKVGPTKAKLIFLANTSRCGSTLVTQVFEQTGSSIAYSEPDALNALTQLKGIVSDEELDKIVIHTINILCKPQSNRNIKSFVIKPCQPSMVATPHLKELFPQSYFLFLYRDGLKVSKSLARAAKGMHLLGLLLIVGRLSSKLTKQMVVEMGLPSEQFERKVSSSIHFCSIVWAAAMRQYLDFRDQGIDIVGLRYEDIINDPNYALGKMFEHCDLEFDAGAVERAMGKDSQRASPLSMDKLGKYQLDEFTDEVKKHTDEVCDSFRVPRLPEKFIAPGTITGNQKQIDSTSIENGVDKKEFI